MKTFTKNLKSPLILSSLLVLPFILLEIINRRSYKEGFPGLLFGILWVLPIVFMLVLKPTLQHIRNREYREVRLWLGVAILILTAILWIVILLDQMPCFLGVPNCD